MFYKFVNEYKDKVYEGHPIRRKFDTYDLLFSILISIIISLPFLFTYFYNIEKLFWGIILTFACFAIFMFLAKELLKDTKKDSLLTLSEIIKKNNYDNKGSMIWLISECSKEVSNYENKLDIAKYISIAIAVLGIIYDNKDSLSLESIIYLSVLSVLIFVVAPVFWKLINTLFDNKGPFYSSLLKDIKYFYYNCSYNKDGKISKKQNICVQFNENAIESNSNENNK